MASIEEMAALSQSGRCHFLYGGRLLLGFTQTLVREKYKKAFDGLFIRSLLVFLAKFNILGFNYYQGAIGFELHDC